MRTLNIVDAMRIDDPESSELRMEGIGLGLIQQVVSEKSPALTVPLIEMSNWFVVVFARPLPAA